jgi:RHH-type rel operon transcriptional repressor/antitoxin RelB
MAMLTLRIDDEMNARIDWLAQRSGRTKSHFVKKMIADALEEMEEQVLDELAIKEFLASSPEDQQTVPWEQVKAELRELELASNPKQKSTKRIGKTGSKPKKPGRSKD